MKRSCQRHTQVFDLPVRRMIALVPTPVRAQQDYLSPPDMLVRAVAVPRQRLQTAAVGRLKRRWNFLFACDRLVCIQVPRNPLPDSNVSRAPLGTGAASVPRLTTILKG